jgi:hypothetical protein
MQQPTQKQIDLIGTYGYTVTNAGRPLTITHKDGGIATRNVAMSVINSICDVEQRLRQHGEKVEEQSKYLQSLNDTKET